MKWTNYADNYREFVPPNKYEEYVKKTINHHLLIITNKVREIFKLIIIVNIYISSLSNFFSHNTI